MKVNGEAIYGTTATPFKEQPAWGRCTKKVARSGATLYLHVFNWPVDGKLVVPALDGKGRLGEEIANGVVKADIGRWVGATIPSDRRLIDAHDLVHVLHALDGVVGAREGARIYQPLPECLVEHLADERALARARGAGDRHQLA